jgi:hypothetical protein
MEVVVAPVIAPQPRLSTRPRNSSWGLGGFGDHTAKEKEKETSGREKEKVPKEKGSGSGSSWEKAKEKEPHAEPPAKKR